MPKYEVEVEWVEVNNARLTVEADDEDDARDAASEELENHPDWDPWSDNEVTYVGKPRLIEEQEDS